MAKTRKRVDIYLPDRRKYPRIEMIFRLRMQLEDREDEYDRVHSKYYHPQEGEDEKLAGMRAMVATCREMGMKTKEEERAWYDQWRDEREALREGEIGNDIENRQDAKKLAAAIQKLPFLDDPQLEIDWISSHPGMRNSDMYIGREEITDIAGLAPSQRAVNMLFHYMKDDYIGKFFEKVLSSSYKRIDANFAGKDPGEDEDNYGDDAGLDRVRRRAYSESMLETENGKKGKDVTLSEKKLNGT